jgi:hypothetical protein
MVMVAHKRGRRLPAVNVCELQQSGPIQSGRSSGLHLCSMNCTLRFSWASETLFIEAKGTLNCLLQIVQTPTAGIVRTHLVTLRLRFGMNTVSHERGDGSTASGR